VYIRYLGTLELLAGNPDGSFGPNSTLTRAEAAVLFEQANGYGTVAHPLPTSAPSAACTFTDVSASDWFAGWVWQACADGFMNGVGGGLFDPSNTLTRGQIVTIFNNINNMLDGGWSGYDYFDTAYSSTLEYQWDHLNPALRSAAWTDVFIGDYYAQGVVESYAVGISEGTDATHFSPDVAITRGEFAKWLYRAISYVPSDYHSNP
jgi:N-acetylmuramoyl-L-alanine amidase